MKTEPQMETVITTIATTNAQTSLLRLSDSSANRVSTAANRVSIAANRVSTAANCSASCSRSCANWTSILALSSTNEARVSTNPACVLTSRSAKSRLVANCSHPPRWLLCHKELRFLLTYRVGEAVVDLGSLLFCQGHYGFSSNSIWSIQGGSGLRASQYHQSHSETIESDERQHIGESVVTIARTSLSLLEVAKPSKARFGGLLRVSLGESFKHDTLFVEYALEPCLKGGVAPSLLDVLSRFVGEVFVILGIGAVSHSELPFLPHLFPHPGTGSSRPGRLLRGDPRFFHSADGFSGCASTQATGGWLDHLAIVCGLGDLRIAIEILRCARTHQRESSRSLLSISVFLGRGKLEGSFCGRNFTSAVADIATVATYPDRLSGSFW